MAEKPGDDAIRGRCKTCLYGNSAVPGSSFR